MLKPKTKLTPVRFPGGKSNALKFLDAHLRKDFVSYREPFFGGGSVGLYLMQFNKEADYWINDLFYPVYCFWEVLYEQPYRMVDFLLHAKKQYSDSVGGAELHKWAREIITTTIESKDEFRTACLWYILNKTSYSGLAMIGTYAPQAWDQNFTNTCISNLPKIHNLMRSVKSIRITNVDYSTMLRPDGDHDDNTFVFLDPPYKIPHSLYGDKGDMHEGFDHKRFVEAVKQCPAQWLITYNEDADLQEWFKGYSQLTWELQYTMKAAKREGQDGSAKTGKSGKKGKELLVANYPLRGVDIPSTPCEPPSSIGPVPSC